MALNYIPCFILTDVPLVFFSVSGWPFLVVLAIFSFVESLFILCSAFISHQQHRTAKKFFVRDERKTKIIGAQDV